MLLSFCPAIFALLLRIGYTSGLASWPDGRYGLLKPKTGCPEEWTGKDWIYTRASAWYHWEYKGWTNKGFIFQVEEDRYSNNKSSKALNIEGYIGPNYILRHFCVKRTDVNESLLWPQGKYCIHGSGRGRIEMDMDNTYGHAIKYVNDFTKNWQSSLALVFSCQTSGKKKIPISLPIIKPFYLLPYESRDCQQVKWMVATCEWIKYQTRNYKGLRYHRVPGTVPYHELGDFDNKGITMYYCYYESCNYTLNGTSGVFQSPGFPGQYPDGQLCSWRIMVPDNRTLHVRFTNFSLSAGDNLKVYKIFRNDSILLIGLIRRIYHQPLMATSADLEFVFSSNERYSSTGFRALYKVFILPKKTTTAPKPQTTTPPPTTTLQPTTKLITTKLPTTKQPTTKLLTAKQPITTELEKIFSPTTANDNSTANETCQCNQTNSKNKSYNKQSIHLVKKTFCEETWRIVVMVIPLAVLILIALVIIDIICRCRSKTLKSGPKGSGADDGMIVNPTYGRGSIVLDQPSGTVTDASMLNTVVDQSQSHDDLDDYEDVDYTQLNEIPPPRRSSKRQECQALEPIGADTSAVFYDVLEPPNTEPGLPQSHAAKPFGNGAPEVFYHTLEPPTGSTAPAYQNPSDGNLYTLNPLYEPAENSAPLEANNLLYDSYI